MNRISHIVGLMALCLPLMLSCAREDRAPEKKVRPEGVQLYSFRAVMAEELKTTLDENGAVSWKAGDSIAVWDAVGERFCTFTTETGDGFFTFEGSVAESYDFVKAIYPASMAKDRGTVTLPESYSQEEAVEGGAFPMLAYVEPDSELLQFRHLGALLRFTVFGVPAEATSLVVSSAETSLSGDFSIDAGGIAGGSVPGEGEDITPGGNIPVRSGVSVPEEIHSTEGNGSVSLTLNSGTRQNLSFFIPLPVGAYSCTLDVMGGDNVITTLTTPTLKDILRKKMVRLQRIASSFSRGSGTAEDPYLIETSDDMEILSAVSKAAEYASACYKLTSDIDMGGESGFTPIGGTSDIVPFKGVFDADGHVISNLRVNAPSHAGLFSKLAGTVKNLKMEGASIVSEGDYAGAIAAVMDSALVEGCLVDANTTVEAGGKMAGSIAGLVHAGTVNACASHANVSAAQSAGGIVGCLNPVAAGQHCLVINCCYEPVYQDGKIAKACIGTDNAVAYMGGIAGAATFYENLSGSQAIPEDADIKIVNCYAYPLEMASSQGASTAIYHVGGILGRADGPATVFNCISPITYSNVLRSGVRVTATSYADLASVAAIVGRIFTEGPVLTRSFSSQAWKKVCGNPGNVNYSHSKNTVHLGDGNLRGLDDAVLNGAVYKAADGGVAAALNEGAEEWNAGNPEVMALSWAYDSTFGYPKPEGVDAPGTVTKKVSVFGDSISTYDGFMFANDNYQQNKHYPNTDKAGDYPNMIMNEQLTWWWRLIYGKMSNARLEACNAWGGSTVSYVTVKTPNMPNNPTAQCQVNSLQKRYIDHGLGSPDILFYFGGRNDYAAIGGNSHDLLGDSSVDSLQAAYNNPSPALYDNYCQGTVAILKTFHEENPQAKIMLMITDLMTDEYEDAAEAIRSFLEDKGYNIRFANLHKRGTVNKENTDIGVPKEQGSHPNSVGCENIANYIWAQLGDWLDE